MQIVIEIPEDLYEECKRLGDKRDTLFESIRNGTTLPKGHGDLIDRNELLDNSYEINSIFCLYDIVVNVDDIKDAPTIIEADKEE